MPDTVHVPGMGETKKSTVYIVAGGFVLVAGIAYYRSKKTAAANAASVAQAGATTTDPATGYPYGSAEDAAALAAQAGYNDGTGYGYGYGGSYPYSTSTPGTIQTGFTSNAAWAQAYESYATQNLNADAATVAAALGKYLTGQSLTNDQLSVVEQAIAFQGIPPQSGANGYPPSYNLIPNGGTPPAGGGPVSTTGSGLPAVGTVIYGPWMIQAGQSINGVAARFGLSTQQIQNANPGLSWVPGRVIRIPWLVKNGQTLQSVAAVFEIPPSQFAAQMTR